MSRSTTDHYLQILRDAGLSEEGPRGFHLGPHIFRLARSARAGLGLSEVATPVPPFRPEAAWPAVSVGTRPPYVLQHHVQAAHPGTPPSSWATPGSQALMPAETTEMTNSGSTPMRSSCL